MFIAFFFLLISLCTRGEITLILNVGGSDKNLWIHREPWWKLVIPVVYFMFGISDTLLCLIVGGGSNCIFSNFSPPKSLYNDPPHFMDFLLVYPPPFLLATPHFRLFWSRKKSKVTRSLLYAFRNDQNRTSFLFS